METTRLEELRSNALELRIDADLEAGAHRDLVPELEALVAEDPLRESWRGQLMRALHGSGRRVDALRVYTEGRRLLAEEVGLDPSSGLQRIEQAILLDPDQPSPSPAAPAAVHPGRLTAAVRPGRLPAALTSFVGRRGEVEEVTRLVERARLVTLTGVGGSGKSRLALQVASSLAPGLPGGAWLVELGGVHDGPAVGTAVADTLGVRQDPDQPVAERVANALAAQRCLLVLDECEHVLDAVAPFVQHLLAHTGDVRVLATSREPLDVPGETTFRVPTMTMPGPDDPVSTLDDLMRYDSVRLFVERASTADAGFRPVDADVPVIAEVCRRLDGLPLALELAAARLDMLTLPQLGERLDDRFELLTSTSRTAPARQRTLKAAIQWSYDLLTPSERMLFNRLSVFAASFTVETAESVCPGEGLERAEVFHLLTSLVRKSLVVRVPGPASSARYRLLDTVREFGRGRLRDDGAEDDLRARHAAFFIDLAERAAAAIHGPGMLRALEELDVEHDEARAALAWLLDRADGEGACRLAAALAPYWDARQHIRDGYRLLDRAVAVAAGARAVDAPPSPSHVWAAVEKAYFAFFLDDFDAAAAAFDEAERLLADAPDDVAQARLLLVRAEVARYLNDPDLAVASCRRATALSHARGDTWGEADAARVLFLVALDQGDVDRQVTASADCLRLFQLCGNTEKIAGAQMLVGGAARGLSRYSTAAALFEDSLGRFQQLGEPHGLAMNLYLLADVLAAEGDYDAAERYAEESLRLYEAIEFPRGIGRGYRMLAEAALGKGDLARARPLCDAAVRLLQARAFVADVLIALATSARIALRAGDVERALEACAEGRGLARAKGLERSAARLCCIEADARLARQELAEAVAAAEAVLALSPAVDVPERVSALVALAEAAAASGDGGGVRARLDAVRALLAESSGEPTAEQRARIERLRALVG